MAGPAIGITVTVPTWTPDDNIRVGNVLELVGPPAAADAFKDLDLTVVAAIMFNASGAIPKMYTKGRDADLALPVTEAFKVYDPNVNYVVEGDGLSFTTDSSGAVPIGSLTMTVDKEPLYELIRSSEVNKAYQYA